MDAFERRIYVIGGQTKLDKHGKLQFDEEDLEAYKRRDDQICAQKKHWENYMQTAYCADIPTEIQTLITRTFEEADKLSLKGKEILKRLIDVREEADLIEILDGTSYFKAYRRSLSATLMPDVNAIIAERNSLIEQFEANQAELAESVKILETHAPMIVMQSAYVPLNMQRN